MAIKLTTTKDAARLNGVKVLVYSKAGRGKTVLTATAPDPVIISAEGGLLSLSPENLARMSKAVGRDLPTNLPVIEISTLPDLVEAFNWAQGSKECEKFQTICLDSLTEIAEKVLANAKAQVKDPRQAYGELIDKMNETVKAFRDLKGKHVYMSAKEEFVKDKDGGVNMFMPSMPGSKVGQQLPYLFDEVFHLDIGSYHDAAQNKDVSYRYLSTQPDYQYDAKDRSGALDAVERPDLSHIIGKILA